MFCIICFVLFRNLNSLSVSLHTHIHTHTYVFKSRQVLNTKVYSISHKSKKVTWSSLVSGEFVYPQYIGRIQARILWWGGDHLVIVRFSWPLLQTLGHFLPHLLVQQRKGPRRTDHRSPASVNYFLLLLFNQYKPEETLKVEGL